METFTKIDEDNLSLTYDVTRKIDLVYCKDELVKIRDKVQRIPKKKTAPDQETLLFWNEFHADMHDLEALKERANYFLDLMRKAYDAGMLPDKWVKPLIEFRDYLKTL